MPLRYVDGTRLRRSVAAAARRVSQRQENLNGINVFPVADGDTGTNLAATLVSAVEQVQRLRPSGLGAASRALADGALFGACGNSGAILAQFLEGFAAELEGCARAGASRLAEAASRASDAAYEALAHPREGTMLSVMRAWADRLGETKAADAGDLMDVYRDALESAREALRRTPEQLKVLSRAGVVDAGAQGFVYLLEGILHFAEGRLSGAVSEEGDHARALRRAEIDVAPEAITFQFCTEVLIEGDALEVAVLREQIADFGDSLVVAGSSRRVRVHVHTDDPEAVFATAARYGRVVRTKADDMRQQHRERFDAERVVVVTETAADLPARDLQRWKIHTVPLRVIVGEDVYLDKETLSTDEVYERLRRGERIRTSQPAAGDYVALFRYLFEHYGRIVVPSLTGALSGTVGVARQAARLVDPERISIVDSRSASVGQGLVVREAAEIAADGGSAADVESAVRRARAQVKLFLGVPTIEYLERGGRVRGWKTRLARSLGLVPILSLDAEVGATRLSGVARRGRVHRAMLAKVRRTIDRQSTQPDRIWIAHAGATDVAEEYREELAARVPTAGIDVVEVGSVLGAHAGPGAVAVAFLGDPIESIRGDEADG